MREMANGLAAFQVRVWRNKSLCLQSIFTNEVVLINFLFGLDVGTNKKVAKASSEIFSKVLVKFSE